MNGRLIVIESGSDGSGKATQSRLLFERLLKDNYKVKKVEFPNYKSGSSEIIKMYLNGNFGKNPEDVNAYAASTFYAVDRFASYKMEWQHFYSQGGIVIADRYTTSNMVHQASKIDNVDERDKFLDWLCNLEYDLYGLPKPDCVLFLDMPPKYSAKLMEKRLNKFTGKKEKDIHENNCEYLMKCYKNSIYIAEKYGWNRVKCIENGKIANVEKIHDNIYKMVQKYIK